ncbi:MAG: glycosyltransferase, partial [Nitrospinota bacterium]
MAGKKRRKNRRKKGDGRAASGPSLSVCLIVRDAADAVGSWVADARRLGDEVVVVDTGSTDGTRERAAEAGARVFSLPWADDFSAARNHALERATGEWVLVLDVDEAVARRDRKAVRRATRRPDADAYRLPTRNYTDRTQAAGWRPCRREYPDEERDAAGWYPTYKVRLFRRRPAFRFRGCVHEMVEESILAAGGRIADLDVPD